MAEYSAQLVETIIRALDQLTSSMSASVVAAIASFIAACGSLWAASSAYRSVRNAQTIARLGMHRSLLQVAHNLVAEEETAQSLVQDIKVQIQSLAVFSGMGSSSVVSETTKKAQGKYEKAAALANEAKKVIEEEEAYRSKSEVDLSRKLSQLDGNFSEARRLTSQLEREVESYAAQNQIHQTASINRGP